MSDLLSPDQDRASGNVPELSPEPPGKNRTCLILGIGLIFLGLCLSSGLVAIYLFGRRLVNTNYQTNPEEAQTLAITGVNQNSDWIPFLQTINYTDIVLVPSGCFKMGSNDPISSDQHPIHEQCFDDPFWIDEYEVTNAQFVTFLNAHADQPEAIGEWLSAYDGEISFSSSTGQWLMPASTANLPVIQINWFGAAAYCDWRGGRLPTEAEWEYAARGPDNLVYPWGNDFVPNNVVYYANAGGHRAFVGSRPTGQSWVGAMDMSGNVREWVGSLYEGYPYDPSGREEALIDTTSQRVLRGGTWSLHTTDVLRAANREKEFPELGYYEEVGFRCAQDFD